MSNQLALPLFVLVFFHFWLQVLSVGLSPLPQIQSLDDRWRRSLPSGSATDVGTVIVASVCLGIAVDDTIHVLSNYKRQRSEGTLEIKVLQICQLLQLLPYYHNDYSCGLFWNIAFGILFPCLLWYHVRRYFINCTHYRPYFSPSSAYFIKRKGFAK